jgi:hypothetical protein
MMQPSLRGCRRFAGSNPGRASDIDVLVDFQTTATKIFQGSLTMGARVLVASLIVTLFSTISAGAQTSPAIARPVSLGERIVSWRNIP